MPPGRGVPCAGFTVDCPFPVALWGGVLTPPWTPRGRCLLFPAGL